MVFHWIVQRTFHEHEVTVRWVESSRRIEPEVERAIEQAWITALARLGSKLFDGAVARCESIEFASDRLTICLSKSSYKIAVGTNFFHPELFDKFGRGVMANMFGVSAGIISADGHLILGRRNARVAYYPNRVHPFAGNLDVRSDINLFDDVRRELHEEIGFDRSDIESIELRGIVEDDRLNHPEAVFIVQSTRSKGEILAGIDPDEHSGAWSMRVDELDVSLDTLTPVARAVVRVVQPAT